LIGGTVGDNLEIAAHLSRTENARNFNQRRGSAKTRANLLVLFTCGIGVECQRRAAIFDDGELIDESFEFADEMRRDENGALAVAKKFAPKETQLNMFVYS